MLPGGWYGVAKWTPDQINIWLLLYFRQFLLNIIIVFQGWKTFATHGIPMRKKIYKIHCYMKSLCLLQKLYTSIHHMIRLNRKVEKMLYCVCHVSVTTVLRNNNVSDGPEQTSSLQRFFRASAAHLQWHALEGKAGGLLKRSLNQAGIAPLWKC